MGEFDLKKLMSDMQGGKNMPEKDNKMKKKNGVSGKNNGQQRNGSNSGQNAERKYVGAPYNFVPFTKKLYTYKDRTPAAHNSVEENLISGEIDYEMTAQTSVFIDDGTKEHHFYKNRDGKYSIPGSSVRGLIRNNVQILGFSGFDDDIDDYALMYRNVAGGAERKRYATILGNRLLPVGNGKSISILKEVQAGYIAKTETGYRIYKTCVDSIKKEYGKMNYYIIPERKMGEEYLKFLSCGEKGKYPYDFFVLNGKYKTQHLLDKKFVKQVRNGKVHYIGIRNRDYKPFYDTVSYKIQDLKNVSAVGKPGEYEKNGTVISTGAMNEKKAVYIIPEIDQKKQPVDIPPKDIEAFKIDIEKRKNTLKQFGGREFFDLPKEGEIKPVFYVELNGRLYFGFTPRLRLFYDHTIKEGLSENQKKKEIDYAKAMFGYSNEQSSYKSRISFSDAVIVQECQEKTGRKLILAEPKPTSYLDYLKQDERNVSTYNSENFELRGVKQYWLHNQEPKVEPLDPRKEKAASTLCPLPAGTKFRGKIRFHNLTEDELGLLLWAVRLEKNSWMNIGKAKAYGYGNISVAVTDAKKIDMEEAYLLTNMLSLSPFKKLDTDALILFYKKFIAEKLQLGSVEKSPRIQGFLTMRDSEQIPAETTIRYMSIDKREYQNRQRPLPEIREVVCKKQ